MMLAPQVPLSGTLSFMLDGVPGTMQTLRIMRALVNQYRVEPLLRQAATSIVFLTPERDGAARPRAIFDWVRDHVRYVPDVLDVETITTPDKTLLGLVGDCDDMAVLLATLYESVGYPTRFVVTSYNDPSQFEHVFLQVRIDDDWIDADPTERVPLGWSAPFAVREFVERV